MGRRPDGLAKSGNRPRFIKDEYDSWQGICHSWCCCDESQTLVCLQRRDTHQSKRCVSFFFTNATILWQVSILGHPRYRAWFEKGVEPFPREHRCSFFADRPRGLRILGNLRRNKMNIDVRPTSARKAGVSWQIEGISRAIVCHSPQRARFDSIDHRDFYLTQHNRVCRVGIVHRHWHSQWHTRNLSYPPPCTVSRPSISSPSDAVPSSTAGRLFACAVLSASVRVL